MLEEMLSSQEKAATCEAEPQENVVVSHDDGGVSTEK